MIIIDDICSAIIYGVSHKREFTLGPLNVSRQRRWPPTCRPTCKLDLSVRTFALDHTRLRTASTTSLPVRRTRLSTTELFLSPLPAPGTTCRATSRPHHPCLFSEAVWRCTSSGVLSGNLCSVPVKWRVIYDTLNVLFHLLTAEIHAPRKNRQ